MLVEKRVRDFQMLLDTEDMGMSTNLLAGSGWEGQAPDIVSELVQPGWTVIEMGACIGFYALVEARRGATVYVIEPVPRNIDIIRKNIDLNGLYLAKAYELAISDKNGYARFELSPGRSDRGKLSEDGGSRVETITLDSFVAREGIERVDFLRFDIEGAEVGLIKGGQNTLSNMPIGSWIFTDIHPSKASRDELLSAMESVLSNGFIPRKGFGEIGSLSPDKFAEAICVSPGFPKVFFEKVK